MVKPNGTADESRKSSTFQPGRVSIKYSDMLLVETAPSLAIKFGPALLIVACVDAVEGEVLGIKLEGCEMAEEEAETGLFTEFCDLRLDRESEALVKRGLEVDDE